MYKKDLAAGRRGEKIVQKILVDAGIKADINKNVSDLLHYDLACKIGEQDFTIECKYDLMEAKTGNVAIEYFNTKKVEPSGIHATKADLWAIVLQKPVTAWITRVDTLSNYFATKKCFKDIKCGGDDNAAMKLYVRTKIFEDIFHRIDNLTNDELYSILTKLLARN